MELVFKVLFFWFTKKFIMPERIPVQLFLIVFFNMNHLIMKILLLPWSRELLIYCYLSIFINWEHSVILYIY